MKRYFIFFLSIAFIFMNAGCSDNDSMEDVVYKGLERSVVQAKLLADELINEKEKLPRTIGLDGNLITSKPRWWTSGFFPGTLWYLYEATGCDTLRSFAEDYTKRIETQQYNTHNHDVGFILFCSYGNAYRLTGDPEYKKVILQGSESLATRYQDNLKLIRSWDWNKDRWQFPVIIDNMMNLEMLEWASKNSENEKFDHIARSHADKTMEHHFRPDNSCYHVISYDTITGLPEKKETHQGFANESSWARGQAWALYGYSMMYRETKDIRYLKHAKKVAEYILNNPNLPDDKIPYWDFDSADIPNTYRDASAAAVMASAFIELSIFVEPDLAGKYLETAETQLKTLTTSEYLAEPGTNGGFILKHSVGSMPEKSEIDVPLTYADYYYIEALLRYKKLKNI